MIKIGVSACFMYPDPTRTVFGHKTLTYLEKDMSLFLSRAGVMPIMIPDLPEAELIPFLNEMDGFVFQGGADLAPETYGETPITGPAPENKKWLGDRHRDLYELKIMDHAFKHQKPILAICRGFQVCNAYFGGTLYQDLAFETQTKVAHRDADKYDHIHHTVKLENDSLFSKIYPELKSKKEMMVNSVHHQGIKKLGKGLVVDAVSPEDKLIEAFHYENMEKHFVVAVQWHPEFSHTLKDKVINPKPLYDYFLNEVLELKEKNA